jgi:hypothetical protein
MMQRVFHQRAGLGGPLLALALLAMLVRAMVAPGYMLAPGQVAGNLVAITLCTGQGAQEALVDLATGTLVGGEDGGHRHGSGKAEKAHTPCVFAAAATVAPPMDAAFLGPVVAFAAFVFSFSEAVTPGRGLAAPPPWPTGPPVFSKP